MQPYEVRHPSGAPAHALRVSCEGRIIAYSGDTDWTDALVEAARGADLFICEAYFFEKQVPHHLDYRTLREHLGRLECRRIILTHPSADVLHRLEEVELEFAEDGRAISLS